MSVRMSREGYWAEGRVVFVKVFEEAKDEEEEYEERLPVLVPTEWCALLEDTDERRPGGFASFSGGVTPRSAA